jgi:hypothetical protein
MAATFDPRMWLAAIAALGGGYALMADRRLAFVVQDCGGEDMVPLHNNERLHDLQLCEAFGTRSYSVMAAFLSQLEKLTGRGWWDPAIQEWRTDEATFNLALALLNSSKPRNEMEACLAAQMVAVHLMQMKLSAMVIESPYDLKTAMVAGKLARTFAGQIETMQGLKGKRRAVKQTITVRKETHQHVHYHHDRGAGESGRQPHAPERPGSAHVSAMQREDESGRVVRLPSRPR